MKQKVDLINRVWVVLTIKLLLLFILILRLIQLSVFHNPHYTVLSKDNRIHCRMLSPQRGRIFGENGKIIAQSRPAFHCYVYATSQEDLNTKIDAIEMILNKPVQLQGVFSPRRILLLAPVLSWKEMAKVMAHNIPNVFIEPSSQREYHLPEAFSHVLGYVSPPTEKDEKLLQHACLFLGHGGGMEQIYDKHLRGSMGFVEEEVDARRRLVRVIGKTNPISGEDMQTTLDLDLQKFIYDALQEESSINSAGVVVLNAKTGAVKALVSYPSYDTNSFVNGISGQSWMEIHKNPYRPLYNKVIQGQYAPGSIFKIIMAIAGLHSGMITDKTSTVCSGYTECGVRKFHCWRWKYGGHGFVDFYKSLSGSCDCFYYQMAKKIKIQDVVRIAKEFGFSKKTGIDLMYEQKGMVPEDQWHRKNQYSLGEKMNLSIGQGRLLTTPLQLSVMMAAVVNGGFLVKPFIKSRVPYIKKICISNDILEKVKKGLDEVANSESGTARRFQFLTPSGTFGFGGKTGTTQVHGISKKDRETGNINNKAECLRDHALFTGYTPCDDPEYIVTVIIEHGGWGANACRFAQKILKKLSG